MRVFFDLARLEIVTEKQIASEYAESDSFTDSFPAYLDDCLAENGGDLKEITSETLITLRAQLFNLY